MATETAEVQLPVVKPKAFEPQTLPSNVAEMSFSDDTTHDDIPAEGPGDVSEDVKPKPEVVDKKVTPEPVDEVEDTTGEAPEEVEEKPTKSVLKPPAKKDVKPEVKPEEKDEDEVVEVKPKPIAPPVKKTRDLSMYTPDQQAVLRSMSNEAFEYTKKLIKDNTTLQQSSYLQHPEAYKLSPDYTSTVTSYTRASQEQQYWESQLEAIDNGQQLVPFRGWDNNTGQAVFGEPMEPTAALKNRVQQAILKCSSYVDSVKQKLQEYPTKYKSQVAEGVQGIDNFRANTFSWIKDPSLEDHSLNIEGVGERTLKQIRQDVNTMVPAFLHGSPLHPLVQDLVIAVRMLQAEKAELESTTKVSKKLKDEADLVEPSTKGKASSSNAKKDKVHGVTEFRIDPDLGI